MDRAGLTKDTSARLERLRAAGEKLRERPAAGIIGCLSRVAARWREPHDVERGAALEALAERYQVPERALIPVLDTALERWGEAGLRGWIESELGTVDALDGFAMIGGVRRRATGPDLVAAIGARGVPTTPIEDLLAALCLKAPIWLKPASGSDDLAARFAEAIRQTDPGVGEAVEVSDWRPGSEAARAVLAAADTIVATGGAETLRALRATAPPDARLLVHGPRLSVAAVSNDAWSRRPADVRDRLARDVAFAGQMGCLSPVVAYIETGSGAADLDEWAEGLRRACEELWPAPARQAEGLGARARWAEWAASVELAAMDGAALLQGDVTTGWAVVVRSALAPPDPEPVPRVLTIVPMETLDRLPELLLGRRGRVASAGVAGRALGDDAWLGRMADAGVERLCPVGTMQAPPAAWRRDGRSTLADLVRWTDLE